MFYLTVFLIFTVMVALALALILILLFCRLISKIKRMNHPLQLILIKKAALFAAIIITINIVLIIGSHLTASTPKITDNNGKTPKNSITELERIELNGRKQWISLRGHDKNNPVLLFLAGGPGGSQLAAVRYELSELEKHFVVVNWDQPGSAKSYNAEKINKITRDTYIEDGHALTEYLKNRFSQDKIFLLGESWGSALGIFLVDKYPQDYHAFIGTGQMIDFAETERIDYRMAMEIAESKGDSVVVKKLKSLGEPPYYGKSMVWKSGLYLNYLTKYMTSNPEIHNSGYDTIRDVGSPEYGLLDKINYFRGIVNTFNNVYQQLYDIDLRKDYTKLEIPVYFFLGRHDVNAPTKLVEKYAELLDAPKKEIIWFEHSGHNPWINEAEKFAQEVVSCFLEN
ncbi:MAG: alpha/beta fold hydrolase [Acutalibacteraceae bacterium]|jgi:pimeloyl-ACP methyl ester carboxylesterase